MIRRVVAIMAADAPDEELQQADAVVVLRGEHDGREGYGIELAREVGVPGESVSRDAERRRIDRGAAGRN